MPSDISAATAAAGPSRPVPSPTRSPPLKRAKPSSPTPPPAPQTSIDEAPVRAMFLPPSAASGAGPLMEKQGSKKELRKDRRKKRNKHMQPDPYSPNEVRWLDVRDFLGKEWVDEVVAREGEEEWEALEGLRLFEEDAVVRVSGMTVAGEGLARWPRSDEPDANGESSNRWALVIPFALPGDLVRVKPVKHDRLHTHADLLETLEFGEDWRGGEGDRRKFPGQGCKYFGECGGCQLQPLPYSLQLAHKKQTVQLAYSRYSSLSSDLVPEVQDTIGSPKQWGYRTKITPHFEAPPKWAQKERTGPSNGKRTPFGLKAPPDGAQDEEAMSNGHAADVAMDEGEVAQGEASSERRKWEVKIGFERKGGRPGILDIEECPIAVPVLNEKLVEERKRVQDTIMSFKRGATLLLRSSLPAPEESTSFDPTTPLLPETAHVAITNHKAPVYERVGPYLFQFSAGSFFQNNNSILLPLVDYVKEAIFPSSSSTTEKAPTHLVDTYCGSGLFGISLHDRFERVAGVEISEQSIDAAKLNAQVNGVDGKSTWLCGKAEDIFGDLPAAGFKGDDSCVVVDPPRKGCDEPFLKQLLDFKPRKVVYVSCNVHTQARDVGWFIREAQARGVEQGWKYQLESVRGFDLFPQTAHVESVAVLKLVGA